MESSMVRDGKIPPVLWIFRAKNYLGMKDLQTLEANTFVSGDVPNNQGDILSALPEVPDNVVDTKSKEDSAS